MTNIIALWLKAAQRDRATGDVPPDREITLRCPICGEGFISDDIVRHVSIDTGTKTFTCSGCYCAVTPEWWR